MQDEIVSRLARTVGLRLTDAEAARLKRTAASNPDAEDLALQCQAAVLRAASGRLEESFPLCEKALALDPNNVRALSFLALKFLPSVGRGAGVGDDVERADKLLSKALALDPDYPDAHAVKALELESKFRFDEAIAEDQRVFDKYPGTAFAYENMGYAYGRLGQFEKSLELIDKALRLSPRDPLLFVWYADKASALLALKQYDQAIEWARRATELRPDILGPHVLVVVALALTGQESQVREALKRYLAIPGAPATVAHWKRIRAEYVTEHSDPRFVEYWDRLIEGLRKAGLPGGDAAFSVIPRP
jgi:tetratricopeptide (TPR) repeat protein